MTNTQPLAPPVIELAGLHKGFGTTRAVDGVDLTVRRGEIVALLGPNGAGKSTTIDLLLGLTRPDRGTAAIFGGPPRAAVARGAVGAMLQTGTLIENLSVRELLAMLASLYARPADVDGVLTLTGLQDVAGKQAAKLSGGQSQRVRFAVALVSDPELMVLDEPTAALDVSGRFDFWAVMRTFAERGRTILFATHYLEEADRFADRIVLMSGGRVVADGSTTEIKSVVQVRTIRATLRGVDVAVLAGLPGVVAADRRGDSVTLSCDDADSALRALLLGYPAAADLEVRGAGLDEAFRRLTGEDEVDLDPAASSDPYRLPLQEATS